MLFFLHFYAILNFCTMLALSPGILGRQQVEIKETINRAANSDLRRHFRSLVSESKLQRQVSSTKDHAELVSEPRAAEETLPLSLI